MPEKHIIVVGAGFSGLTAALKLAGDPTLISRGYEIILIDRHHHHLYTPGLYEIASIPHEYAEDHSLVSSSLISIPEIIRGRQIRFIAGDLSGIDRLKRRIILQNGGALAYEYLILALGSETNYFDIPGLKEYSLPLKTCDDALRLRSTVEKAIRRNRSLTVLIGGAGATGVELAAELVNFACAVEEKKSPYAPRCSTQIILIEAAKQILPGFRRYAVRHARLRLKRLGIGFKLGDPIVAASKNTITLRSGGRLRYDVLIWTGGVKGPEILARLGLELSPRGTLLVDRTLRAGKPQDRIFAVGDNAWLINPRTRRPVPWNVPAAEAEAAHVARQISRVIRGAKLQRFRPLIKYPVALAVGRKYGIIDIGRLRIAGFAGWCLKQLAELRYLLFILSWSRALRLWWRNVRLYRAND